MKILLTGVSLLLVAVSLAQTNFKRNDLYLEAGGSGLFASLNFERQLAKEPGLGLRIGLGYYAEEISYLTLPAGINYLFKLKDKGSFIDVGLGLTWTINEVRLLDPGKRGINFVNFTPGIGYRKHTAKDWMWRISLTPIANKHTLVPWLGVSIGKRF